MKTSFLKMTQSKKAGVKMPLYAIPTQKNEKPKKKNLLNFGNDLQSEILNPYETLCIFKHASF